MGPYGNLFKIRLTFFCFTFSHILYIFALGISFFSPKYYESYCQKSPIGEILKKSVNLLVWSRDYINMDFFLAII